MTTMQKKKENLSLAYIRVIAAKAGVNISIPEDDYGIDLQFREVITLNRNGETRIVENGISIDVQLKCSHDTDVQEDHLIYDLEAKNYNDLICEANTPRILILFKVPRNEEDWITQDDDKLLLRHCAYWHSFSGNESTRNSSSIRVKIPLRQKFSPDALINLFQKIKKGVEL